MQSAEHDVTLQMPRATGRRPRPPWPTIALAVAAVVAVVTLGLTLMSGNGQNVRSERLPTALTTMPAASPTTVTATPVTAAAPPTTAGRPTTTAAPSTTAAPVRLADARLSLDGLGPVDVGMTLDQASRAAGTSFHLLGAREPGGDCVYARADAAPAGVLFMVINGRIERIDVGGAGPSRVTTVSGIGIGSTEADIQRTYPGRIRVEGHPYVPGGHYLIYTPADRSLSHLSMIFETDGTRVTSFRAGLVGAVAQIEGCS